VGGLESTQEVGDSKGLAKRPVQAHSGRGAVRSALRDDYFSTRSNSPVDAFTAIRSLASS
jgi:hypothetical protein